MFCGSFVCSQSNLLLDFWVTLSCASSRLPTVCPFASLRGCRPKNCKQAPVKNKRNPLSKPMILLSPVAGDSLSATHKQVRISNSSEQMLELEAIDTGSIFQLTLTPKHKDFNCCCHEMNAQKTGGNRRNVVINFGSKHWLSLFMKVSSDGNRDCDPLIPLLD